MRGSGSSSFRETTLPAAPFANLLISVNGGTPVSGAVTCHIGDVIQFSSQSVSQLNTLYEIPVTRFPKTFATPAGWTLTLGTLSYTGLVPPPFTIAQWGKWLPRLTVEHGLNNGVFDPTRVWEASAITVLSPVQGLKDFGGQETNQFAVSWVQDQQDNLRAMELLSSPGAVTWANDLAGSTGSTQSVVSLTGTAGAVTVKAAGLTWATSVTAPTISQADNTGSLATGQPLAIHAQNATGFSSIGGALSLASGTGTATPGAIKMYAGATQVGQLGFAATDFLTWGNSLSLCRWQTVAGPGPNGVAMYAGASAASPIFSNYSIFTDGATLSLNSGVGNNIFLNTGNASKMVVSPTLVQFNVPAQFFRGVTSPAVTVQDNITASTTGSTLTIQAQNSTAITSIGGNLVLSPGTGTSSNGFINFNNIATVSTVGAAGAASAMPTPLGYAPFLMNGTAVRIAYFN